MHLPAGTRKYLGRCERKISRVVLYVQRCKQQMEVRTKHSSGFKAHDVEAELGHVRCLCMIADQQWPRVYKYIGITLGMTKTTWC